MSDYRNISIRNKRATYDFEILDTYIAGIVLTGTEIKSLRLGKASLTDCYCYFHNGELFVRGMNIAEYHWGTYNNHIPKRDRKLLLNRKELVKLQRSLQDKGLSVVGLKLFINDGGLPSCKSVWERAAKALTNGSTSKSAIPAKRSPKCSANNPAR